MSMSLQPTPSPSPSDRDEDVDMKEQEEEVEDSSSEAAQDPLLALAQDLFLLAAPDAGLEPAERKELMQSVLVRIREGDMAGLWAHLESRRSDAASEASYRFLAESGFTYDAAAVAAMQQRNAEAVKAADSKVEEAREIAGDTEVREALWHRAQLHAKWGNRSQALTELSEVFDKTVGVASKVDVLMAKLRVSLAFLNTIDSQGDENLKQFKEDLEKAKVLIDQGGDWERKNQLSVYESLYLLITRQFPEASRLLLDSVATFTASELFSYREFVTHACALALVCVQRDSLHKDVLKSPEILSVLDEIPGLGDLLHNLYKCNYGDFFRALATLLPTLQRSRYLAPHLQFYLRELRVVAYTQFLASYKSANLSAMAASFGVSADFMDHELFRFISSGRIHAKIDRVAGRVDTTRPDQRNQLYAGLVKNGDGLLNRLQKLSKIVAL